MESLKNEDLEVIDVDSHAFIFEFRRREDYMRILQGRPWSIQGNEAADHLAAVTLRRMVPSSWLTQPPSSLLLVLQRDLRSLAISGRNRTGVGSLVGSDCIF
ncbi:uncharacterized protein LOC114744289 [Neltuma alba]|uniref:uncharacterized protein LOC114744289 n=1 Tax=Neltuma alba TaxID=207710 RepID=UPI0010A47415|nr:uncharacterized protein LOC114744289 [Prosopis alba]